MERLEDAVLRKAAEDKKALHRLGLLSPHFCIISFGIYRLPSLGVESGIGTQEEHDPQVESGGK